MSRFITEPRECPRCNGTRFGVIIQLKHGKTHKADPCVQCGGLGYIQHTVQVKPSVIVNETLPAAKRGRGRAVANA